VRDREEKKETRARLVLKPSMKEQPLEGVVHSAEERKMIRGGKANSCESSQAESRGNGTRGWDRARTSNRILPTRKRRLKNGRTDRSRNAQGEKLEVDTRRGGRRCRGDRKEVTCSKERRRRLKSLPSWQG